MTPTVTPEQNEIPYSWDVTLRMPGKFEKPRSAYLSSRTVDYDPDLVDELMHYALMSADGLKAAIDLAASEPHTPTIEERAVRWRLYIHRSAVMLPPDWCELVERSSTDVLAIARRLRKVTGADEIRLVEALAARNSMSARAMLAVQSRMDAQVVEDVRAVFAGEADLVVAVRREWPMRMALCMGRHLLNEWLGQWEVAISGLESMARIELATREPVDNVRRADELAPEAAIREVTETLRGLL